MTVRPTFDDAGRFAPLTPDLRERFVSIVGPSNVLVADRDDLSAYLEEPRALYEGRAALVLKPASTDEVAAILRLASETGTAVVPQGGNTGLVGGQIPFDSGGEIILSLTRMDRIRHVDPASNAMIIEAGVTLAKAQQVADGADRLFPLSLASEGTCQIGGNLATNAGGMAVLAYGSMRSLTLGLEVVTADGRTWNGLKTLRKDNTGYDLRDLFIGSEGTLGIITAAALKLFPRPATLCTAFVALSDLPAAVSLLTLTQAMSEGQVTRFELMPRLGLDFVLRHGSGTRDPLSTRAEWYALIEVSSANDEATVSRNVEAVLAHGAEQGLVADATIAASLSQSDALWRLRELMSEVQKLEGGSIKHDVSVSVARIPEMIDAASRAALKIVPGARPVPFGHIGDGNIHFNVSQPPGMDKQEFLERWDEVSEAVHAVVIQLDGSISAEHGIGRMKREMLARTADPVGLDLMRTIKTALDPKGILNPGKVL